MNSSAFLNRIKPISHKIQNNHTVKRSMIMSLKDDYIIFYKYDFFKEIQRIQRTKNLSREDMKEIFQRHIRPITDKNSHNICSSRLINNAFENERFKLEPKNEKDRAFCEKFFEDKKKYNLAESYEEEALMKLTGNLSDLENNIERIFNEIKNTDCKDIDQIDINNCFYFSQLQIYRSKEILLKFIEQAINKFNINIKSLNQNDVLKIREYVYREHLNLKSSPDCFDYQKKPFVLKRAKKFWLGDCDTVYLPGEKIKRMCICGACKNESESDCVWDDILIKTFEEAIFFLSPHQILYFPSNSKNPLKLDELKQNLNLIMLINAFFHILIDNESIDELFETTLTLLNENKFYQYHIKMIDNLYKVESSLKKIKNVNSYIGIDDKKLILDKINDIQNNLNYKYNYYDNDNRFFSNFDDAVLIDAFLKKNKIKIYTDCLHPEHDGVYIYKRPYPLGHYHEYLIVKGK